MAAKTGKGYEKHGNRWRVKAVKDGGTRGWYSFETEEEAAEFAAIQRTLPPPQFRVHKTKSISITSFLPPHRTGPTVVAYARDIFAARDLKRSTQEMYATALRRIDQEPLGQMDITLVTPLQVREFFGAVEKNRANVKAVLSMTFTAARREGLIRTSPMDGAQVKLPKSRPSSDTPLTVAEIEHAAQAASSPRDSLAIRLGGFAGLRAGEVGGLKVEDIDFARCRINIRNNAQRWTKRDGETSSVGIDTPKSAKSVRLLTVDCALTEELRAYIEANPSEDGFVFHTPQGNLCSEQTFRYGFYKALERAGIRRVKYHGLRHAYATRLAEAGLAMPVLQRVMGWSSIAMTDVYAHIQGDAMDEAADITARLRDAAATPALPEPQKALPAG